MPQEPAVNAKEYLLISDFDQTLSFNDSGYVLSELLGIPGFANRVKKLANTHLVQQGGELSYLLVHDPDFRRVRKEHLRETGKKIRLKENIRLLSQLLQGLEGYHFTFYVVSASPQEVIESALEGIVPPDHVYGGQLEYDAATGEVKSVLELRAGYGKVVMVDELRTRTPVSHDHIIYVGDGSSDIHVMLHVNRLDGLTIAVSENKYLAPIAKRTILSDDALSVLIPIFEDIGGWDSPRIRSLLESHGFVLQDWEKVRTDSLTIVKAAGK
jgi:2-hydroxy-3-keto-5-methylthiopentenyl-1-phosphate phosphatase